MEVDEILVQPHEAVNLTLLLRPLQVSRRIIKCLGNYIMAMRERGVEAEWKV